MVAASVDDVKRSDNKAIAKAYRHHFHCHCKGSLLSFPVPLQHIQRVELHHFQCFQGLTASLPVCSMVRPYPVQDKVSDIMLHSTCWVSMQWCIGSEEETASHLRGQAS